jgi:arylsulfatase
MKHAQPNILLLFPDQHRWDWMPYARTIRDAHGLTDIPLRMPNVASLMEAGTTFMRAVTPSPLCAPARACLASGLHYGRCRVVDNGSDYPLSQRTFYSVLKENGYTVGGCGKFDLHKNTKWWGLEGWIEDLGTLGFTVGVDNAGKIDAVASGKEEPKDPYMNYLYEKGLAPVHIADMTDRGNRTDATPLPEDAYCDNWLTNNGLKLLRDFPEHRPWFLQVNFTGPHSPWDITGVMKERWGETNFPGPMLSDEPTDTANAIRQNYAAMLENIDRNIGLLLKEVHRRGEEERTLVIYASDHGEMLGDFNKYGKGVPYRAAVQIPFVVAGPGVRSGEVSEALVELQDVAATVLEYAGLHMPEAVDSVSLMPVLQGERETHRNYQTSALAQRNRKGKMWHTVADLQHRLIVRGNEAPELYDLSVDPWELTNIADSQPDVVQRLMALLER